MENKLGPWYVDKNLGHVVSKKDMSFAESFSTANDVALIRCPDQQRKEVSNLIAAAPELYEALEKLYLEAMTFLNEGDFKRKITWDVEYIEKALRKAKGEPEPEPQPETEDDSGALGF